MRCIEVTQLKNNDQDQCSIHMMCISYIIHKDGEIQRKQSSKKKIKKPKNDQRRIGKEATTKAIQIKIKKLIKTK